MSKTTKMPERKLRREGNAIQIGGAGEPAWKISKPAARAWPFNPQDVPPPAWWRTLPSDLFRDAEHLLVIHALDTIRVMHRRDEFAPALRGAAAAAIGTALSLLLISAVTLLVDIAMTALLRRALGGDATGALVLSSLLHRIELDYPFARELSASWHTHNGHHLLSPWSHALADEVPLSALNLNFKDRLAVEIAGEGSEDGA
jgi:hypothetical protein